MEQRRAYYALIVFYLIMGAMTPMAKLAVDAAEPVTMLAVRFSVAAICLLPYYWWYRRREPIGRRDFMRLAPLALMNTAGMYLFFYALEYTEAVQAALIGRLSGPVMTLMGIWFLKESQSRSEWIGLGITLLGSLMILLGSGLDEVRAGFGSVGNAMMVVVVFMMAASMIVYKKYFTHLPRGHFIFLLVMSNLVVTLVVASYQGTMPVTSDLANWRILVPALYMALAGTLLGNVLRYYSFERVPASNGILFSYISPVISIPASVLLFGDAIYPVQIAGLAVTLVGVWYARKTKRIRDVVYQAMPAFVRGW